jgi:hypothetical protein
MNPAERMSLNEKVFNSRFSYDSMTELLAMINRSVNGCQVELKIEEGWPGSRGGFISESNPHNEY